MESFIQRQLLELHQVRACSVHCEVRFRPWLSPTWKETLHYLLYQSNYEVRLNNLWKDCFQSRRSNIGNSSWLFAHAPSNTSSIYSSGIIDKPGFLLNGINTIVSVRADGASVNWLEPCLSLLITDLPDILRTVVAEQSHCFSESPCWSFPALTRSSVCLGRLGIYTAHFLYNTKYYL